MESKDCKVAAEKASSNSALIATEDILADRNTMGFSYGVVVIKASFVIDELSKMAASTVINSCSMGSNFNSLHSCC
jgi:hypothetical protein